MLVDLNYIITIIIIFSCEFIFLKERGAKTNEERRGYGFWEKLLRSTKKKERVKASHAIVKKYCTDTTVPPLLMPKTLAIHLVGKPPNPMVLSLSFPHFFTHLINSPIM